MSVPDSATLVPLSSPDDCYSGCKSCNYPNLIGSTRSYHVYVRHHDQEVLLETEKGLCVACDMKPTGSRRMRKVTVVALAGKTVYSARTGGEYKVSCQMLLGTW